MIFERIYNSFKIFDLFHKSMIISFIQLYITKSYSILNSLKLVKYIYLLLKLSYYLRHNEIIIDKNNYYH